MVALTPLEASLKQGIEAGPRLTAPHNAFPFKYGWAEQDVKKEAELVSGIFGENGGENGPAGVALRIV